MDPRQALRFPHNHTATPLIEIQMDLFPKDGYFPCILGGWNKMDMLLLVTPGSFSGHNQDHGGH